MTSPRGSLCAVRESMKTHSSEMLWQSARVRVDLHVSTWGSFSDLSSWRISPVVEALIPAARRRQHLQGNLHQEHTPGYGDTPPCRAYGAAEGAAQGVLGPGANGTPLHPVTWALTLGGGPRKSVGSSFTNL